MSSFLTGCGDDITGFGDVLTGFGDELTGFGDELTGFAVTDGYCNKIHSLLYVGTE